MGYMIGNYEVIEKLGGGAMGDVFKGRDPKTNKIVALKILSEDLSNNQRAIERFKREIRQTIQLDHPNIITAYTAGEFKGRLYYVMEYVEGTTVKKELLTRGTYDDHRVIEIVIQMAEALEYAAQFGLIHRDIKPDNIMITYDGKGKLCDLGLAKSTESDTKLTVMGTVLGTPHYMSTEQASGEEKLDTRTDIFSLGATCYHMLSGSPPFEGSDPITIMTAVLEEEPTPIQERMPKVGNPLCAVVNKMMAKDRNKRYQTWRELLDDLKKIKQNKLTQDMLPDFWPQLSKTRQHHFRDSYVLCEADVLLGQIATHNKLVTLQKMEGCLNRQEALALTGIYLSLSDIFVEQKIITPQQKGILDRAKVQYLLDRGDEAFLKICNNQGLLNQNELLEVQKLKKAQAKGLCAILTANRIIDEDKRQKMVAAIAHSVSGEENKIVLRVALENGLLTQQQAEKCSRIYSNNVVMGKYRNVGDILSEKGYLNKDAYKAVLCAVRRSSLTGAPASKYLKEKRLT